MRAIFLGMLILTEAASAAPPSSGVTQQLLNCIDVADSAQRLICFDREARMVRNAVAARDIVIVDKAEVRETRRSLFGFALPHIRLFGGHDAEKTGLEAEERDDVAKLDTKITTARPGGGYGLYVITLETGGTWQTTEANRDFSPRSGQTILVERGVLGNYTAKVGGKRAVRIRRIG